MTRLQRRIIFWLLVLFFILVTPLVLSYALGYSYDWPEHRLVKTGAFYFKSKPAKAKIYINGKYRGKTSRLIKRLKPRTYQVRISMEGDHPWEKQLSIQSRQITEARNIVLFPKNPSINEAAQGIVDIEEFLKSPGQISNEQKANRLLANLPEIFTWQVCEESILYLQGPSLVLYRTDLISGQIKEQLALQPLPEQKNQVEFQDLNYHIICASPERVAILDPQGKLFLFNPTKKIFEKIEERVKGVSFAADYKKLLYWTNNEIWTIWLEEALIQPYREKGDKVLITRFSQKIGQVVWYTKDNEHLIFTIGDKIKIAELDNRDFVNIVDFLEIKNPQIFYSDKERVLYILNDNILYKTEI